MTTGRVVVSLRGLKMSRGRRRVLDTINLDLHAGEIAAIVGRSGSGKSTLLRLIAGLERPDAGEIHILDRPVVAPGRWDPPEVRRAGLVFQDYALFPHLTVHQNVAFSLSHVERTARLDTAHALLADMRLADRADAWPHELSGGEQQRIAVARALAARPDVLLLDEPFSNLDGTLKRELRDLLFESLRARGIPVLLVTHDAEDALAGADTVILLGEGRIMQSGSPQACYDLPVSAEAATLLGEVNVLDAQVSRGVATTAFGAFDAVGCPGGPAQVGVRPEAWRIDEGGVDAVVQDVRFSGSSTWVRLKRLGRSIRWRTARSGLRAGESVKLLAGSPVPSVWSGSQHPHAT